MTTYAQDVAFIRDMIDQSLLDSAVEWIAKELTPGEVFSEEQLREWADAHGFVKGE